MFYVIRIGCLSFVFREHKTTSYERTFGEINSERSVKPLSTMFGTDSIADLGSIPNKLFGVLFKYTKYFENTFFFVLNTVIKNILNTFVIHISNTVSSIICFKLF